MAKVYINKILEDGIIKVEIFCPGCKEKHQFIVSEKAWSFNGDIDKPTFFPDMLVEQDFPELRCHFNIIDGFIQFLSDSTHEFKDTVQELPIIL